MSFYLFQKKSDIDFLKKIFHDEFFFGDCNPEIKILLKKKGVLFREGSYEVSEFIEEGDYKGVLEIHVVPGPSEEFRIYIIPEVHESIPKIFGKIFR